MHEIKRIVPNIFYSDTKASMDFYIGFLGMEVIMDMEWIITFAAKSDHQLQVSIIKSDQEKDAIDNSSVFLSMEVDDVYHLYEKAQEMGFEITYPLCLEEWGVKRFFVKDPSGATINILSHN